MADGLDRKDATTPEYDLGTEAEPAPVVDGEAGDDGAQPDPLPDAFAESSRPTVRPASPKSYGPPQRRSGAHMAASKVSEPEVFGVSISAIALMAVSCGMQGMLQHSIDSNRHDLETRIDERLASAESQVSKIVDEYNSAAEAASTAEEANADLAEAREDLRQTMADARAWLESGNGQWVGNQTETMMLNALDAAQNLIDETGITDPQTYRDAAASIEDIIDGVKQGTLW